MVERAMSFNRWDKKQKQKWVLKKEHIVSKCRIKKNKWEGKYWDVIL